MTPRQKNIFDAIRYAYMHAKYVYNEERENLESEYAKYLEEANEDKLTRIQDIATLFFLAMFLFGEG